MEPMRNAMKVAVIAALPVLAAALAAPAGADGVAVRADVGGVQIGVAAGDARLGPVRLKGDYRAGRYYGHPKPPHERPRRNKPEPLLFGTGPVNDFARDAARAAQQEKHKRPRHRYKRRPIYVPYYYYSDFDDGTYVEDGRDFVEGGDALRDGDDLAAAEDTAPLDAASPPEPGAPRIAEEPSALDVPDARGPRFERARGAVAERTPYAVGQPLPRGVPHVALDWQDYGLPRPPAGEVYVRFAGAVLRIEAASRVVTDILWPTEG